MEELNIKILNPKARMLLMNLVDLNLITIESKSTPHKHLANIQKNKKKELSDFQNFLLMGPTMSDEQYQVFKENRKQFNKWRQS